MRAYKRSQFRNVVTRVHWRCWQGILTEHSLCKALFKEKIRYENSQEKISSDVTHQICTLSFRCQFSMSFCVLWETTPSFNHSLQLKNILPFFWTTNFTDLYRIAHCTLPDEKLSLQTESNSILCGPIIFSEIISWLLVKQHGFENFAVLTKHE